MPDKYDIFRVFIASPSDVAAERQLAEEPIMHINERIRDTLYTATEPRK